MKFHEDVRVGKSTCSFYLAHILMYTGAVAPGALAREGFTDEDPASLPDQASPALMKPGSPESRGCGLAGSRAVPSPRAVLCVLCALSEAGPCPDERA